MVGGLGRVNITAGGTPQALMANTAAARVGRVRIQIALASTGLVYIGGPSMVKTTGVGVYAVLTVPVVTAGGLIPSFEMGDPSGTTVGADLSQIYIDGTTNDGVYVCWS